MGTRKTLLLLLALIPFYCCHAQYSISCRLNGFADSTLLYLESVNDQKIFDSALVVSNQCTFKGLLKENVTQVKIATQNNSNYKYFWLENTEITFTAEKGKFKNAVISGSKTQDEANVLNSFINPIRNTRDSLLNELKKDTTDAVQERTEHIYSQAQEKETKQYQLFIKRYPASVVSVSVLNTFLTVWDKPTIKDLYQKLTPEIQNTAYGKEVILFLQVNKNLKPGDKYVDFTQPDPSGKNISVSDFKNKIVLLEFWASWCYGCVETNPQLVQLYKKYKDKNFEIIGISLDSKKQDWLKAIEKGNLNWTQLSDLNGAHNKAALIYGINAIPDNFLIDKTGKILARNINAQTLDKKLAELCNK